MNSFLRPLSAGLTAGTLVVFRSVSFASVYFAAPELSPNLDLSIFSLILSSLLAQLWYNLRKPADAGIVCCVSSSAVPFYASMVEIVLAAARGRGTARPCSSLTATLLVVFSVASLVYSVVLWGLRCGGERALLLVKQV